MEIESEVARLRTDVLAGAAIISRAAAGILTRASRELPAASSTELAQAVTLLALRILDAQPAMAPLITLAREVLTALEPAASLDETRMRIGAAATVFAERLPRRLANVSANAARLLPRARPILTLSSSSSVEGALAEAAGSGRVSVVCLESRPMNEGRVLASALSQRGIPVTLAVDAALDSVIGGCGALLLGADSIGDSGIVNKIGSAAACHAAIRHGIPAFVVADSSKLLPRGFPQRLDDDRPPEDVWPEHGAVHVINRYFEAFPTALVRCVVTEDGALDPGTLERAREALHVPDALSAWAASRA